MSTLKIIVEPKTLVAPTVSAGPDLEHIIPLGIATASPISITAVASDPDGFIASYQWVLVSGPGTVFIGGANTPTITITGITTIGVYELMITVTDNDGVTATDTVLITAINDNIAPTSNPGQNMVVDISTYNAQLVDTYDASFSGIANVYHMQINSTTIQAVKDIFDSDANAGIEFIVNHIGTAHPGNIIDIQTLNGIPTGGISIEFPDGFDPTAVPHETALGNQSALIATYARRHFILDGSASFDIDGTISTYEWTETVGSVTTPTSIVTPSQSITKVRQVAEEGLRNYTLRVTDDDDADDIAAVAINVIENASQNPPTITTVSVLRDSLGQVIGSLASGTNLDTFQHSQPREFDVNVSDLDNHDVNISILLRTSGGATILNDVKSVIGGNGSATFEINTPVISGTPAMPVMYILEILATDSDGLTDLTIRNVGLIDSNSASPPGGMANITVDSDSFTSCSSVRVITVSIPAGEARTIEHTLSSNSATITPSPGTITEDTQYTMTIHGNNAGGTTAFDSATIRVKSGGSVEATNTLTRSHSGINC